MLTEDLINIIAARQGTDAQVAADINRDFTYLQPNSWLTDRTMDIVIGPAATAAVMLMLEALHASPIPPQGMDEQTFAGMKYNVGRWLDRIKGDGIDMGTQQAQDAVALLAVVPGLEIIAQVQPALRAFATRRNAPLVALAPPAGRDITEAEVTEARALIARRAEATTLTEQANEWLDTQTSTYEQRHATFIAAVETWKSTGQGTKPEIANI